MYIYIYIERERYHTSIPPGLEGASRLTKRVPTMIGGMADAAETDETAGMTLECRVGFMNIHYELACSHA